MTPSNYNSAQLPFGTVPPVVMPAFTLADYREELKDLLYSQQRVMSEYVQILGKRLERSGETFSHAS